MIIVPSFRADLAFYMDKCSIHLKTFLLSTLWIIATQLLLWWPIFIGLPLFKLALVFKGSLIKM